MSLRRPDLDPDMLTVVEILQHASEIVSRMPLAAAKARLQQHRPDDPHADWYAAALRFVDSAMLLELDGGKLSAIEHRAVLPPVSDTISDSPGYTMPDDRWAG